MIKLTGDELIKLIESVFPAFPGDKKLGILVDIPRVKENDNPDWQQRRALAEEWFHTLGNNVTVMGLEAAALIAYPDVASNNADLPDQAFFIKNNLPTTADQLPETGQPVLFEEVFKEFQLYLAPTEYSTTAPLKNAAKIYGFRAATMPGFTPKMIPALRIDYNEVSRRVTILKEKLDPALWAEVIFTDTNSNSYKMFFDLRYRKAHLSPGRFPEKSTAGNLPSGETYIVPYEGELGEKSQTRGILPVQIGNDIVRFIIEENKAVGIEGNGKTSEAEK
ncbi:MAG: hypothetical protein QG657_300, partial [Acidobacteriota bacterium]|nr:hypothetical protein [Acidobacteriota bacterium]